MVADQFLTGLDNHELRVQAATSDVQRIEELMRIARSLEAVEGEEAGRSRVRRGPNQTRFTDETDGPESEATHIADQIWAKIGPDHAVEMGHLNVISVKDLGISCVTVPVLTFTRWDPMDCQ